jgi:hypothetical protein
MNLETIRKVRAYIHTLRPGEIISVYNICKALNVSRLTVIECLEWIYALGLEFPNEQEISRKLVTNKSGNHFRQFSRKIKKGDDLK